jgi:two-component system, OmpR family, response regulator ResD
MKNSTLLLVDDDLAVLAALTNALRSRGFTVIDSCNGEEAVQLAGAHPELEVVLLDINMPRMNGWEVLRELQLSRPLVPVIVITALPDQLDRASENGVAALLEKPLDIPLLLQTIEDVRSETPAQRLERLTRHQPAPKYVSARQGAVA